MKVQALKGRQLPVNWLSRQPVAPQTGRRSLQPALSDSFWSLRQHPLNRMPSKPALNIFIAFTRGADYRDPLLRAATCPFHTKKQSQEGFHNGGRDSPLSSASRPSCCKIASSFPVSILLRHFAGKNLNNPASILNNSRLPEFDRLGTSRRSSKTPEEMRWASLKGASSGTWTRLVYGGNRWERLFQLDWDVCSTLTGSFVSPQ